MTGRLEASATAASATGAGATDVSRADGLQLVPSLLRHRDLLSEAIAGLVQRPGRSVLTMLGTVLGVGSFVAILGLTSTATGQIDKSFSYLQATTVTVDDTPPAASQASVGLDFPADADQRVDALNGVVAAGVWWPAPLRNPTIGVTPLPLNSPQAVGGLTIYAASPGTLSAMQASVSSGVLYNDFHQTRAEHVCVLGIAAADLLGISGTANQPAVFINNTAYTVVGIISDTQRLPAMLTGIIVPSSTALADWGEPNAGSAQMVIRTRIGAASLIAHQAALDLRPDDPALLTALPPPNPHSLQDNVNTDLSGLFLLLAAICLVIGAVGIANTTMVAILERTGEIGLRRSLGALPRHIAVQFLSESTFLGALGGLIGTSLGVLVVVSVAVAKSWTAVLDPATVLAAPFVGAVVGLLAGLYPSVRAARIEPLDALR